MSKHRPRAARIGRGIASHMDYYLTATRRRQLRMMARMYRVPLRLL